MSSYREQQKLLDVLKKYEREMSKEDLDAFKMFLKRQLDEEDFDSVSMKKLKTMHDKYYKPVDRSKFDSFFKKKEE
jgi:hypothetical protein